MLDLKLIIEGEWWDSLLYKGQLHLFGADGSLGVYNWDGLIDDLSQRLGDAKGALRFAFSESNALYRDTMDVTYVRECFNALSVAEFEISLKKLKEFNVRLAGNDFPFPHATSAFHYDRMIITTARGLYGAHYDSDTCERTQATKLSSVAANEGWPGYGTVAVAAGTNGLFQVDLNLSDSGWAKENDGRQLSDLPCETCDWMSNNIVGSSHGNGSVIARFNKLKTSYPGSGFSSGIEKKPRSVDSLEPLLGGRRESDSPLIWGSNDKLYKVEGRTMSVFRLLYDGSTRLIGNVPIPRNLESLVAVRTALFGVVFEFDDSLIVLTSDLNAHKIEKEPVNWRVFPRSRRYENHLHVVRDDYLEVLSFNTDALQDQFRKLVGNRAARGD